MINTTYIFICLCFALCLSLTAGGILVLFRAPHSSKSGLRFLKYFLVMLHVFGYYSLWSRILIKQFADTPNVEAIASIVAMLGIPFFVVSLMMLLVWAAAVQEMSVKVLVLLPPVICIGDVLLFLQMGESSEVAARSAYSLTGFLSLAVVAGILVIGKARILDKGLEKLLLPLIASAGVIHLSYLTPLAQNAYYEIAFVLMFFLSNTAFAVFYTYLTPEEVEQPAVSLEDFLQRHGISKREADIVREIYAGKTNQEIANSLFISLQTVKDHSSRIYQKTFVKNRAQLTTLVRESMVRASQK